jgi:tetratricopeptide (TPR) repeat protein
LSDGQNAVSSASPSGNVLDQAIAEFEKIVALEPKEVEDRMILGQLYTVKHQNKKAEEQFKIAQAIEPDSEEVVLNLARLYADSGDVEHAAKVIETVPVSGRGARGQPHPACSGQTRRSRSRRASAGPRPGQTPSWARPMSS